MVAHVADDLEKGMREKKCLREKPICQREEKEREKTKARSSGCSWWLLVMVTTGLVVAACGGAMKG